MYTMSTKVPRCVLCINIVTICMITSESNFTVTLFITWIIHGLFAHVTKGAVPIKGGAVCDGPISRFACNVINYFCTKFAAFITKYTIDTVCQCTKCRTQASAKIFKFYFSCRSS